MWIGHSSHYSGQQGIAIIYYQGMKRWSSEYGGMLRRWRKKLDRRKGRLKGVGGEGEVSGVWVGKIKNEVDSIWGGSLFQYHLTSPHLWTQLKYKSFLLLLLCNSFTSFRDRTVYQISSVSVPSPLSAQLWGSPPPHIYILMSLVSLFSPSP